MDREVRGSAYSPDAAGVDKPGGGGIKWSGLVLGLLFTVV